MRDFQSKHNNMIYEKAAGLESHQFTREEHRFNAINERQLDYSNIPRQPRVGLNTRNDSDGVFQFGNKLGFKSERDRFVFEPVDQAEKQRHENARKKWNNRVVVKRNWLGDIEKERWDRMHEAYEQRQSMLQGKREKSQMGKSSVSYNPITCDYEASNSGKTLALLDAEAKHRISIRAARLYAKNNTFHPILCVDTPDAIINQNSKAAGVSSKKARGRRVELEVNSTQHPTTNILGKVIEKNASVLKGLTGVEPAIPNVQSLASYPVSWYRHY